MSNADLFQLVQAILKNMIFISVGGAAALIFFFVFAPHILGSKLINKQLEALHSQTEKMHDQLSQITEQLKQANQERIDKFDPIAPDFSEKILE